MMVKGDVKCLHCGFVSGSWVGAGGAPLTTAGFTGVSVSGAEGPGGGRAIHCIRCRGPVILHEAQPVKSSERLRRIQRLRERLAAYDAPDEGFAA